MWQTIPNFIKYEISTAGKVRHRSHLRILKQSRPSNGYLQVKIYNDIAKRFISKCIHQLMAITFMPQRPPRHDVAHLDENKENNKLLNLGYLSYAKNRNKKTRTMNCCLFCGTKTYYKFYCSKQCRWFGTRVLVTCEVCEKQFYRSKGQLRATTPIRGYTRGRIYCSQKCAGIGNRKKRKFVMTKGKLYLLERIFAKEISDGILQSKDKRYKDLEKQGYVRPSTIIFSGRFPVKAEGWILTEQGHYAYCKSCEQKESQTLGYMEAIRTS
jgi:hypothetical protein